MRRAGAELIKVGVVGAGRIAERVHIPNLRRLPGVVVEGVVDPDAERRRVIRSRWPETPVFETTDDLLESRAPDALIVCTPPEHHAEGARQALAGGTHLYLEKPIATRSAEARDIVQAWRASPKIAAMGFNYRFHPGIGELKRRVEAGEVGAVIAIRTLFSVPSAVGSGWWSAPSRGGGALIDLGSHHLDLVRFVTGLEVEEVAAAPAKGSVGRDTVFLTLDLTDGSVANCLFVHGGPEVDRFEIIGESGVLSLDRLAGRVEHVERRFGHDRRSALRRAGHLARVAAGEAGRSPGEPSYRLALAAFLGAIRGAAGPLPSLADGLCALELAEAAVESAGTRKALRIDAGLAG